MKSISIRLAVVCCFSLFSTFAVADVFHYNNVLIGDRAVGLGGAYGAVSDDASGVYYNPAGLAFALSNDVSGSANALYTKKVEYKNTIGSSSFKEESGGTLAPFFGGLQKLDRYAKGLVFAFGVYTPDSELKDQDDLIKNATMSNTNVANGPQASDGSNEWDGTTAYLNKINRLHRTVNQRAATLYVGGAVGYRISSTFSVGFGLNYITIDELVQEFQDIMQSQKYTQGTNSKFTGTALSQNIRQHLTVYALEPVLGVQAAFGGQFSVGLTLKAPMIASESFEFNKEVRTTTYADETVFNEIADDDGGSPTSISGVSLANTYDKSDDALESLPMEARVGFAWFASTRLLVAADIIHKGEAKPTKGTYKSWYEREAVTNWAVGAEYYILPVMPVRFGLFTNYDARPEVEDGKSNQPDHIDYMGESLFVSWTQANSQISIGLILQQGSGKAQKAGGSNIQDVEASMQTVGFSASHSF